MNAKQSEDADTNGHLPVTETDVSIRLEKKKERKKKKRNLSVLCPQRYLPRLHCALSHMASPGLLCFVFCHASGRRGELCTDGFNPSLRPLLAPAEETGFFFFSFCQTDIFSAFYSLEQTILHLSAAADVCHHANRLSLAQHVELN